MAVQKLTNFEETVVAASATAAGALAATTRGRLRGILITNAGSAGTIVIKDGGAGGTTIFTHTTSAVAGDIFIPIPGMGIKFLTDLHLATLTNITNVVAFYGVDALEQGVA